jgi:hypothetical protein
LFVLHATAVSTTDLVCNFHEINGVYNCRIANQIITDNVSQIFNISGRHILGQTDEMVRGVEVMATSNVPFVIPQLFEQFQNIFRFRVLSSGLLRIQSNAFGNASKLELIVVNSNPLHTIESNAFVGAKMLRTLDLNGNQIANVLDDSFNGLSSLRDLMLENNRITRFSKNIFKPLKNVESIFLSSNRIATVEDELFQGLRHLRSIDLMSNRISEINRNFMDGLNSLRSLNILNNRCASNFWIIGGSTIVDTVLSELNACFANYDRLTRMQLEVRGKVVISDEYDNEVLSF